MNRGAHEAGRRFASGKEWLGMDLPSGDPGAAQPFFNGPPPLTLLVHVPHEGRPLRAEKRYDQLLVLPCHRSPFRWVITAGQC